MGNKFKSKGETQEARGFRICQGAHQGPWWRRLGQGGWRRRRAERGPRLRIPGLGATLKPTQTSEVPLAFLNSATVSSQGRAMACSSLSLPHLQEALQTTGVHGSVS